MNTIQTLRGPVERIVLDKEQLQAYEADISVRRHIQRYGMIRHHLYGTVLDCACGVGYGTFLISQNPEVHHVIGVDNSEEAIRLANQQFAGESITFVCRDLAEFVTPARIDVLVSMETIEHLPDPHALPSLARRLGIPHVIVSFPSKRSTHYNPYHYHDFRRQDVMDLFDEYLLYHKLDIFGEVEVLLFTLHPRLINVPRPGRGDGSAGVGAPHIGPPGLRRTPPRVPPRPHGS